MGYAIDWSDLEQRIQDQKAALLDTSQNMDPERLKFLVETYDECKGESVFITRAKLFEKVLNNKKIYLDGNPIVGSLAGGRAMIYAYPEWQCNWVKDDLDSEKLALSSLGEVRFSDETKEILKKVYKTWKGKTTYDRANKLYKELYGGNAELLVKCGTTTPRVPAWPTIRPCSPRGSEGSSKRSKPRTRPSPSTLPTGPRSNSTGPARSPSTRS